MKIFKAALSALYCYIMLTGLLKSHIVFLIWLLSLIIVLGAHSHKGFDIDYFAYNSKLYNVNPYIKTIFFIAALVVCVACKNIYACVFTLAAMVFITIIVGGISFHNYKGLMTIPLYFIILSTITMAVELKGGIHITREGQIEGLRLALTGVSAISCLYALTLSTPVSDITEVLRKCKIPSVIIELMFLIYRFIFVLSDITANMLKAAKARYGFNSYKNSINTYGHIAKNLLIYSMKKSNDYYDAMLSRGYKGSIAFYCDYEGVKIRYIIFGVIYFIIIGVICLV